MNVKIMNTRQVKNHMVNKFRYFTRLDSKLVNKISEILFYSILYVLFSIYVGILINSMFPAFDDKKMISLFLLKYYYNLPLQL